MAERIQTPPIPPTWLVVVLLVALTIGVYWLFPAPRDGDIRIDIPYSQFKALVSQGHVSAIELSGEKVEGELGAPLAIGPRQESSRLFSTLLPQWPDESLFPLLQEQSVTIKVNPAQGNTGSTLLLALLPWVLVMVFWFWLIRRASRNIAGGLGSRGSELGKFLDHKPPVARVPDVRFGDVAGQENAKREVTELVEYLKNPNQFRRLGAEIPRGVLLMGPPGTGKTLMARALAGEAGVPFFSISGSEFIEVFVGVGASRVRKLFESAKQQAPSIIFIDELDSVGRTRGTGLGGGHDEREQTLNQILAEMDGFQEHEAVIVLAATNRPDVLDPALLRPGRFDRHVTLDLPDIEDRYKILQVHTRRVPLAKDVELHTIAAGTPGFSGADLKNLINEAAIIATRLHLTEVGKEQLEEAREKLIMGTVRTLVIQPEERHRLAVHESGHTLAALFLPHADPIYKVTIIPRGRSLGGTHQLPEEERHTLPEEYLRDRLAVVMAGRCAEKVLLSSVSSGADDDIRQATNLARAMVGRWGMSEKIGPVDYRESESHPFLGREIAQPRRFSDHSARQIDEAVHEVISHAEERATEIISQHKSELEALVALLEEKETLYKDDITHCIKTTSLSPPSLRYLRPKES